MFQDAFNFMMENEDATRAYKTVPDAPPGAMAISGINSFAFPNQFKVINAVAQAERGPAIEQFYQIIFWNKWFDALTSIDLASRVFDAAVNMGPVEAVKLLQKAVNSIVPNTLIDDGEWGPNTVKQANNISSAINVVNAFKNTRAQHYKDIVAKNPADEKYLNNWLARAMK
jgi:lysozyme family protein